MVFLGPHPWHMEVPRLGGQIVSLAARLYHNSWQPWILNPLSEARDQTFILLGTSRVHYGWAIKGTPELVFNRWQRIWWALQWQNENRIFYLYLDLWAWIQRDGGRLPVKVAFALGLKLLLRIKSTRKVRKILGIGNAFQKYNLYVLAKDWLYNEGGN